MVLIDNKLVQRDIFDEAFACDLAKCKGACCEKGEYGAPLDEIEIETIKNVADVVLEYLPEENKQKILMEDFSVFYSGMDKKGTPLMENGACAFLIKEEGGDQIGMCAFEKAWEEGKTDFKKPISCHLYPIRIERNDRIDMDYLNYDRWDICKSACSLGQKLGKPLYEFCEDALKRKYGTEFFSELQTVAKALENPENAED